ncbi:DEAD/DEAH box helicase [Corynebacterium sp. zg254]|uniref:DEAD/DEAH box helicase n=1 Tax=Corynebacterium zhongnanshanii TaxID=2768834 RepID=A0ABQ6VGT4_9CORY|nr:DEAD/DEAH box helicase [Corynebacterium zhongnanshanii]MCR5913922.1 DEAD/DEAH box helicase [Corynebacterium sp. zg254]
MISRCHCTRRCSSVTIIAVYKHRVPERWVHVATGSTALTFADLGVAMEIIEALEDRGIRTPFSIQELALPVALRGRDIIGQARTGTGKTLGFGIPLLDRVFDDAEVSAPDGTPRALVVVPTRELCAQVAEDLVSAGEHLPLKIKAVYGGVAFEPQIAALKSGVDVLVGTPGRVLDLSRRGHLTLSTVEILVLDEADEMLDQGFIEDMRTILLLAKPPQGHRQTMLFSATLPAPVMELTREFMRKPVRIQADSGSSKATHESTRQVVFQSHQLDREEALAKILGAAEVERTIVFVRTQRQAGMLGEKLYKRGFPACSIHGGLRQVERERSLKAFRTGQVSVIVATDVAARGIDVEGVSHVINVQCPTDERSYVHRIGRTGRAGQEGMAITLVGWDEVHRWNAIAESLGLQQFVDPPQWFSESPDFLESVGLTPGRRSRRRRR